jgi:hypothetical protein
MIPESAHFTVDGLPVLVQDLFLFKIRLNLYATHI